MSHGKQRLIMDSIGHKTIGRVSAACTVWRSAGPPIKGPVSWSRTRVHTQIGLRATSPALQMPAGHSHLGLGGLGATGTSGSCQGPGRCSQSNYCGWRCWHSWQTGGQCGFGSLHQPHTSVGGSTGTAPAAATALAPSPRSLGMENIINLTTAAPDAKPPLHPVAA